MIPHIFPLFILSAVSGNGIQGYVGPYERPSEPQLSNDIDIDLIKELNNKAQGNWASSPTSIKAALGLLLEGSSGNTAAEISDILLLNTDLSQARSKMRNFHKSLKVAHEKPGVEVKIANKIFTKKGLATKNLQHVMQSYDTETSAVNFHDSRKASKDINSWVSQKTNNYITEIVRPADIQADSQIMIVNAVYFKGEWQYGFQPNMTRQEPFSTRNSVKDVTTMATIGQLKSAKIDRLKAEVVELPYKDTRYSMVIVLPDKFTPIDKVISQLRCNQNFLATLDRMEPNELEIRLPKFSISYNVDLVPILKNLGLNDIFSDKADLSGFTGSKLKVTSFVHQAKIDVSENGTVAGAANALNAQLLSAVERNKMIINRPFLFFIRDTESGFLFEGIVEDPSQITPDVRSTQSPWGNYQHGYQWPNQ